VAAAIGGFRLAPQKEDDVREAVVALKEKGAKYGRFVPDTWVTLPPRHASREASMPWKRIEPWTSSLAELGDLIRRYSCLPNDPTTY